ncbi:SulP family inorganic anion transporter [Vogesella sp. LIG4]|uniref:SulP family inorganic anion transporter n=1 Tax=Vogesella sp. LIG4 TaxID=1192162 RepID=UPI00081FD50C|nr:SulP family inorganic anion transporter [Vogesella sp. LIG4]SCK11862.1 sulfate permease, SulP family [Vogesella sp. LIG4]
MTRWLPPWLQHYQRQWLVGDISAGLLVALLLLPQGLAYALVAGLPPQLGLYASLLPLPLYALLGRSHAQSVGPMAVTSLLVAASLGKLGLAAASTDYLLAAIWLALLSGVLLLLFGLLRLGFLADVLSEPVLAGFTAASALLIVLSQLGPLAGFRAPGASLPAILSSLWAHAGHYSWPALLIGIPGVLLLWWGRSRLSRLLHRLGLRGLPQALLVRGLPLLALLGSMLLVGLPGWQGQLPQVGRIPAGLPALAWPALPSCGLLPLVMPAFFIALVNYVQSLSVAQLLAIPRRETVDPDRELLALGVCNIGAGLCGGFPVTGGLTRSVVNAEAGANSQLASLITAALIAALLAWGSGMLSALPLTMLAATIVAAVAPQVRLQPLLHAWRAERSDAIAFAVTFLLVLWLGVDSGIVAGVVISLAAWLMKSSRPHMAELGLLPGGSHFRNVQRYQQCQTLPGVLILRIDESLYFGNARHVRDALLARLAAAGQVHTLLLVMSAVNRVDITGLAMLERLDDTLAERGVRVQLAEVKGPVWDVFGKAGLASRFSGRVYLSTFAAWQALLPPPEFHI